MSCHWKGAVFASALAVTLSATASGEAPGTNRAEEAADPRTAEPSGFLGDLPLERHPDDDDRLVYVREEGVLRGRRIFVVDPILVYVDAESLGRGVEPNKLAELAQLLRDEVVEQLEEGGYRVEPAAVPGAVRIRGAITGVNLSRSGVNATAKVAGIVTGVGLLVPSIDVGGASIEALFLDAETDEVLAAVADSRKGRRFLNVRSTLKAGDAKKAFRKWAKELREHLDRINATDPDPGAG